MTKVLYAVQGTGNGHLARATDLIPALKRHADVDVLVSGYQSEITLRHPVKYRYRGLSFIFGQRGGIDLSKTMLEARLGQLRQDVNTVPVESYDLVINDFEPVTAWACRQRDVPCISFSHQAAVMHPAAPKPRRKDPLGKFILENYAPAQFALGFHFDNYAESIATPVVREEIRALETDTLGHYTVYLPAYDDEKLLRLLGEVSETRWHIFSKKIKRSKKIGKVNIYPVDQACFSESIRTSQGVLCGAGFELPSEALVLRKKLMVVPMKGQYEQQCNAASLKLLGVPTLKKLSPKRLDRVREWVASKDLIEVNYLNETQARVDQVMESKSWLKAATSTAGSPPKNYDNFVDVALKQVEK